MSSALTGLYIGTVAGFITSEVLKKLEATTTVKKVISQRKPPETPIEGYVPNLTRDHLSIAMFYAGICSTYEHDTIDMIQQWPTEEENGKWETCHGYIQWIFPTPFQSRATRPPPVLTKAVAIFIKGENTSQIYQNIHFFLKFIGIDTN